MSAANWGIRGRGLNIFFRGRNVHQEEGAISEHFLLICLWLEQKRAGQTPALNPGTRASLVKVLAEQGVQKPKTYCDNKLFAILSFT